VPARIGSQQAVFEEERKNAKDSQHSQKRQMTFWRLLRAFANFAFRLFCSATEQQRMEEHVRVSPEAMRAGQV
jgi:hypothetical protein